jgi:Xaa-Pro aminopeptidase
MKEFRNLQASALLVAAVLFAQPASAQPASSYDSSVFAARRAALMTRIGHGLVLIRSYDGAKKWEDPGHRQDANFYYYTGLINLQHAVLALDARNRSTWLFVGTLESPIASSDGWNQPPQDSVTLRPGNSGESAFGIDHVRPWSEFVAFVNGRIRADRAQVFYVDDGGVVGVLAGNGANPPGLDTMDNWYVRWAHVLREKWPKVPQINLRPITNAQRERKDASELLALRKAMQITVLGMNAVVAALRPGMTQDALQGVFIAATMGAGADGQGYWPWIAAGPHAYDAAVFRGFLDYHDYDRVIQPGDLVRIAGAADLNMYKGDLARTYPASGTFTSGQRETLDLLTSAYHAGVAEMRAGRAPDDVIKACIAYVRGRSGSIKSETTRSALGQLVNRQTWYLYTHGLDVEEETPQQLLARFAVGDVIQFAPSIHADGQDYAIEDSFLITQRDAEIINVGLPTTTAEIEASMRSSSHRLTRSAERRTLNAIKSGSMD